MKKHILDFVIWATDGSPYKLNSFNKFKYQIFKLLVPVYDSYKAEKFTNLIMDNLSKLVEFKQEFVYNCYEVSFKIKNTEITFYCDEQFI